MKLLGRFAYMTKTQFPGNSFEEVVKKMREEHYLFETEDQLRVLKYLHSSIANM